VTEGQVDTKDNQEGSLVLLPLQVPYSYIDFCKSTNIERSPRS
jgi:hypothetical protein